jgi:4-aminobutyrate aminotransferase
MFAFEHYDIVPDMVVLGKGLGGGVFPLAALIAREHLNVAAHTALGHYTHEKNPVACAAGLATLEVIRDENLLAHATELGRWTVEQLNAMKQRHPLIGEVRGLGLLMGVELLRADGSRAKEEAERVMYECLSRGLNFKVTMGNILTLTPALVITQDQMARALEILDVAIGAVEQRAV